MSERKKFELPQKTKSNTTPTLAYKPPLVCQVSFTDSHNTGYFFDTKTGKYVLCIKGIKQLQRMSRP